MRILPLGPYVKLPVGHDPREGCAEMGGGTPCERCLWRRTWSFLGDTILVRGVPELARGRYVNLASLWTRRWRSLRATIRENDAPKWAGGRYAIPPPFFPFLRSSSLYSPLCLGLLSSLPHLRFSLFPLPSSFLSPPSLTLRKRPSSTLTPSPGSPGSSLGFPSLGCLSSRVPSGSSDSLNCQFCIALYCIGLHCVASHHFCITLCCLEVHCIAMRYIALPLHWLHSFRCFELLRIELYGCVIVGHSSLFGPRYCYFVDSCSSQPWVTTSVQL